MKRVDHLILIEHVARELDVACLLKFYLEQRGQTVAIRHLYFDLDQTLSTLSPKVVVAPFFYRADEKAITDYVQAYPKARFFNLAWEEIFYHGHQNLKRPSGAVALNQVVHHAWGNFYADYLKGSGVASDHIFVNGNPAYQLYNPKYRAYFADRAELASRYGLDPSRRWLLIPENYNWAFITYSTMFWRASRGGNLTEMMAMRRYARRCLRVLLNWAAQLAADEPIEVIVRPKPATGLREIGRFFSRAVGAKPPRLHFIKSESVRDWIINSDVVASSFSTTLIEAALAGKSVTMVEPEPLIEAFQADWYRYLKPVTSYAGFRRAVATTQTSNSAELKDWATNAMLRPADCVVSLANYLARLAR